MAAQGVRSIDMATDLGLNESTVGAWRTAKNLPSIESAVVLADYLSAPSLLHMVSRERTIACQLCERPFIPTNRGGLKRLYCSEICQRTGVAQRRSMANRKEWGKVHTRWENRYHRAQTAIDAMCNECADWEGVCRMAKCPLRSVSPLPLVVEVVA